MNAPDRFELFLLQDGEKKIEEKVFTVAHPNVPELFIRIQTDGSITPREALVGACKQLVAMYGQLGREFQKELALRQYADQGEQGGGVNGGANGGHY
ncbi:DNA-directed RNA polymerase II subunit RPB11, variant [Neurospora crassa OR74A]|uniref:DNA-directed RNA polymerase II subunit RPB11, variant n=1 Tax=Neurospora crassa (strain ATCC 24698 / 74-OR23-1A / CBS 708.71 / DSM 1257 / FGSC 987) TaxID=367110 RepID=V5ILF8_NEUCR|nr:DNA-directed RNA polymerase II subunit RPB11, variant [Neurospora crassa OR74A]ESA42467.1 DNA-directed RNA polymerase II subunit RPB11, variant [Neurospora crassa OR74A]|eukprot:XP_011394593.1 DNA-directed RNA polymerase II subunit RPB11, variant [Neurospora crassa OR74A]